MDEEKPEEEQSTNGSGGGEEDFKYDDFSQEKMYRGTFVGTPLYVSPEMLRDSISGFFSDFWALGCILYRFFVGDVPFRANHDYQTFELILSGKFNMPSDLPDAAKDIIHGLLQVNPMKRYGTGPPGKKCEPDKILGSGNSYEDLLAHPFFENIDWDKLSTTPVPVNEEEVLEKMQAKKTFDINSGEGATMVFDAKQEEHKAVKTGMRCKRFITL